MTNKYKLLYYKVKINEIMEMENDSTKEFRTKGKVKLHINENIIILTDVYYLKASKIIISLTKFIAKGYQVI